MKQKPSNLLLSFLVGVGLLGAHVPPLYPQEESLPPVQPKPVENWRPPKARRTGPGTVLPDSPPAREIEPLTGRVGPGEPPSSVRREFSLPAPEEPPVEEEAAESWNELLAQTLRPAVLAVPNRLTVVRDGAVLREGPGLDFPRVGTFFAGDSVRRLDTDDGWHRVEITSGTKGWVYSDLTRPIEEIPSIVIGDRVNLRSAPSTDGLVLGTLYRGAIVTASERRGEWTRIHTPNLKEAFISSLYLRELPPKHSPNPPLHEYASHNDNLVASLALVEETTTETAYLLAVWGDEWVKGGKIGLLYLSPKRTQIAETNASTGGLFTEGAFFESSLRREEFEQGFATMVSLPSDSETVTVAYMRGKKKDQIWLFEFAVNRARSGGGFAIVCQEGNQTGAYQLLEEKR